MAGSQRASVQRTGRARRGAVPMAMVLFLAEGACTERGYDYEEGRMASFRPPASWRGASDGLLLLGFHRAWVRVPTDQGPGLPRRP